MKLRTFVPSSQRWCSGSVFSEVVSSARASVGAGNQAPKSAPNRRIWHLEMREPQDPIQSAKQGLEELSRSLVSNNNTISPPELVVLQPTDVTTTEDSLAYLREILPVGAQFLERHASIGTSLGRTNAHGKPLDTHVAGICHYFPSLSNDSVGGDDVDQIASLAELLDVYLPTRLALAASHFSNNHDTDIDEDDWEAVMENTDLILYSKDDDNTSDSMVLDRWKRIWKSQQQNDCQETYALCANAQDALQLETIFEKFCYCRETTP